MISRAMAFNQSCFGLRANIEIVFPDFLYYSLKSSIKKIINSSHGSVFNTIALKDFDKIEINIPDLETQKKVVRILSALDNKIELNNQQNQTLEKIADGMVKKFQNEQTGKIKLSEIMSFDNGFAFKSKDYLSEGKYKVITIKNVQDGNVDSNDAQCLELLPKDLKKHHQLSVGDILLSLTGNVGRVGIVFEPNLLLNQRVAKIHAKDEALKPFLYFVFRQESFKAELENLAKGTAQLNLSPVETLEKFINYDEEAALMLSGKLKPIFDRIIVSKRQIKELSNIRDALLPKLMNGEINLDGVKINDVF